MYANLSVPLFCSSKNQCLYTQFNARLLFVCEVGFEFWAWKGGESNLILKLGRNWNSSSPTTDNTIPSLFPIFYPFRTVSVDIIFHSSPLLLLATNFWVLFWGRLLGVEKKAMFQLRFGIRTQVGCYKTGVCGLSWIDWGFFWVVGFFLLFRDLRSGELLFLACEVGKVQSCT